MKSWLIYPLLLAVFVGCASGPSKVGEIPAVPERDTQGYHIGVGDEISVQVWKSPELSVQVPVRPDGKISAPLVGDVVAAGQTTQQLSEVLAEKFATYVRNPQVTVIVLNPASGEYLRRVRVTGAVKNPTSVSHQQGMTVLDLVLEAGGLTDFAVGNRASLYRRYGDKTEVFPVRLDDILQKGRLETNYQLAPSDILTIPERVF